MDSNSNTKTSKRSFKDYKKKQQSHSGTKNFAPTEVNPTTVEFHDFNQLKKKSVRGLLRKRAKKYECKGIRFIYVCS